MHQCFDAAVGCASSSTQILTPFDFSLLLDLVFMSQSSVYKLCQIRSRNAIFSLPKFVLRYLRRKLPTLAMAAAGGEIYFLFFKWERNGTMETFLNVARKIMKKKILQLKLCRIQRERRKGHSQIVSLQAITFFSLHIRLRFLLNAGN